MFHPGEAPLLKGRPVPGPRGLPMAVAAAALAVVAAIVVCSLMLASRERHERDASRDRAVLGYVTGFMTRFTSVDPFHANDYVSRILAEATGEFAKKFQANANSILLQVARAEPATGTVLDAGVQRWNDDGTVNVMVVTAVTSKSPDEKQVIENTNRWTATATQEGNQWKISSLASVI